MRDLHFALRSFRKNPGFVVVAIATLALGIGANTAIFSLISAVLLRPLPFFEPDRLVQLNEFDPRNGVGPVIFQHLENWRKHSTSFEGMFTYGVISRNFQSANSPERITALRAETGLFQMASVVALVNPALI